MQTIMTFQAFFIPAHSVADPDPGSGIRCLLTPGSGIRDPGWVESQHPDPGSEIRDDQPVSYFLEPRNHFFGFLGVKILKFFDADPGSGMETVWIRDPGSGINMLDPQQCQRNGNKLSDFSSIHLYSICFLRQNPKSLTGEKSTLAES
jgi:hypothetical protein